MARLRTLKRAEFSGLVRGEREGQGVRVCKDVAMVIIWVLEIEVLNFQLDIEGSGGKCSCTNPCGPDVQVRSSGSGGAVLVELSSKLY